MPKRVIRGIVVIVLIVTAGALGWMAGRPRETEPATGTAAAQAIAVAAAPVLVETVAETTEITGTVTPLQTVTVISKVTGPVEWLAGDVGTLVRKGDVIARIDGADLQLQRSKPKPSTSRPKLPDRLRPALPPRKGGRPKPPWPRPKRVSVCGGATSGPGSSSSKASLPRCL